LGKIIANSEAQYPKNMTETEIEAALVELLRRYERAVLRQV